MKKVLIVFTVILASCGGTSNPVTINPPTSPPPISGIVLAADGIEIACAAAAPDVSANVAAWLGTCPTIINTVIAGLQATSTTQEVMIIVNGLNQFVAAAPLGLNTTDTNLIKSVTAAVTQFLILYQQQTANLVTFPKFQVASALFAPKKVVLTKEDKKELNRLKKRSGNLAKRFPKK